MDKQAVANDLAALLFDAEASIELAIGRGAKFLEALSCARPLLSLSAVADGGSMQKVASSLALLGQARAEIVSAHLRLDRAAKSAGITELAGGGFKPPPDATHVPPLIRSDGERIVA